VGEDDRGEGAVPGGVRRADEAGATDGGALPLDATSGGAVPAWPFVVAGLLLVVAALLAPWSARRWYQRRRWAAPGLQPAEAAWLDVLEAAADAELEPLPTETVRDLARRLPSHGRLPAVGREALAAIVGAVERQRYAGGAAPGADDADQLRAQAGVVRQELLAALLPRDRRRATWWPASGRTHISRAVGSWSAGVDRLVGRWMTQVRELSRRARRDDGPSAAPSDA
jgi:hypothetical protein